VTTHLEIRLDQIEAIGRRARALARNAVGDPDRDYWLSDVLGELDALNAAIVVLRRELKELPKFRAVFQQTHCPH
jgi:hypothetical protein